MIADDLLIAAGMTWDAGPYVTKRFDTSAGTRIIGLKARLGNELYGWYAEISLDATEEEIHEAMALNHQRARETLKLLLEGKK